jgi:hypothetical protein
VDGGKMDENLSEFAPGGRFAALKANNFVVVNLRANRTGNVRQAQRKKDKITAFFKLGGFSSCRCVFGEEESSELITLKG